MAADSPVSKLLARARAAQAEYERFDQAEVDDVVASIAWTILEPERNRYLSERAVEDTVWGTLTINSGKTTARPWDCFAISREHSRWV